MHSADSVGKFSRGRILYTKMVSVALTVDRLAVWQMPINKKMVLSVN